MATTIKSLSLRANTHETFSVFALEEKNLLQIFCKRRPCETYFGAFMLLGVVNPWKTEEFFQVSFRRSLKTFSRRVFAISNCLEGDKGMSRGTKFSLNLSRVSRAISIAVIRNALTIFMSVP